MPKEVKLLDSIRKAVRINHKELDDEISDLIESAKDDLKLVGIVVDEEETLIKRAITLYVKHSFASDIKIGEALLFSYNSLKNRLSLSEKHRGVDDEK